MADGRLEEAYRLVVNPAVRGHHSGQQLVRRLVERLVERGRTHLAEGRLAEAQEDCRHAAQLAGNQVDVLRLQDEVRRRATHEQAERMQRQQIAQRAQRQIGQGQLTMGWNLCQGLNEDDPVRAELAVQLAERRQQIARHLESARRQIRQEQWAEAADELLELERLKPRDPQGSELRRQLIDKLQQVARQQLAAGRLDRVDANLGLLERLAAEGVECDELRRSVQVFRSIGQQLQSVDLGQMARQLKLLCQQLPQVKWLQEAARQAQDLASASEAMATGPLGLLDGARPEHDGIWLEQPSRLPLQAAPVTPPAEDRTMRDAFLLHVEGAGSAMVLCRSVVTVGSAHSSRTPDLPLMGPSNMPRIVLERTDGDYFLQSEEPVAINGQPSRSKLMADGDVIQPVQRARLTFRLPCAASGSAVLELGSVRLPRSDTRRVILMEDALLLSGDRQGHMVVPGLREPLVLQLRQGQPTVKVGQQTVTLRWGQACDAGGVTVTATRIPPYESPLCAGSRDT